MIDFYDLIYNIQKRPAMYLGLPSIIHLQSFLAGYFLARHQLGVVETEQEKHFADFESWIQKKFKITSNQSWDKIILFFSQDEHEALKLFFELFDEFLTKDQKKETSVVNHCLH